MELYGSRPRKMQDKQGPGRIHVYYGRGVGKTTRTMGLAVRAAGAGLRVHFVQFMKSGDSGEVEAFRAIPGIRYYCPGIHPFITAGGPDAVHREHAQKALAYARETIDMGAELLVCDEILNTLLFGVLPLASVLTLIDRCRGRLELSITGSDAPEEVIRAADYATEFIQTKHPYYDGVPARQGIEW